MKTITIAFVTARHEPHFQWFLASLYAQTKEANVIVIDLFHPRTRQEQLDKTAQLEKYFKLPPAAVDNPFSVEFHAPKPTIWQGEGRLTSQDWWAMSNARNTAICLCKTDYIVFLDDRCVLGEMWLRGIRDAAEGQYAVCGTYEKHHNMVVEGGVIKDFGILDGKDHRQTNRGLVNCFGQFWGGTLGCPLEQALAINGFNELLDGFGHEDYHFGNTLVNAGYVTMFDPRIKIIQDRSPDKCGPGMPRTSKERFPNDTQDKGHTALRKFAESKRSEHHWNLREIREKVLAGEKFPGTETCPRLDWFDGKPICEIVPP